MVPYSNKKKFRKTASTPSTSTQTTSNTEQLSSHIIQLVAAAIRPDRHDVVYHFDRKAGEFRDEDRCESRAVGALVGGVAAGRRGDLVEVRVAAKT